MYINSITLDFYEGCRAVIRFWRETTQINFNRRFVAGFLTGRPGFAPKAVHVGFVVDKVAMG
jgi:hypothetical protein